MPATANPRRADDIRQHNLGLLLSELHRDGELTRAELTQRLGLSRSTIGVLVTDLAELGLVSAQVPTGGDRAGRPSHVVGLREDGPYVIAVDVDITHVRIAAVGLGGKVLVRKDVPLTLRAAAPTPSPSSRPFCAPLSSCANRCRRMHGLSAWA